MLDIILRSILSFRFHLEETTILADNLLLRLVGYFRINIIIRRILSFRFHLEET